MEFNWETGTVISMSADMPILCMSYAWDGGKYGVRRMERVLTEFDEDELVVGDGLFVGALGEDEDAFVSLDLLGGHGEEEEGEAEESPESGTHG
jgi:hypothetical protein